MIYDRTIIDNLWTYSQGGVSKLPGWVNSLDDVSSFAPAAYDDLIDVWIKIKPPKYLGGGQ